MKKRNYDWPFWLIALIVFTCYTILIHYKNGSTTTWAIMFSGTVICVLVLWNGFTVIKNNPPQIGIVTKWGERLWKTIDGEPTVVYVEEGWNWLFLRHLMHGIILIDMVKVEINFSQQKLVTPDTATTNVDCALAYIPDRNNIVNYINAGGNEGIKNLVTSIKEEQLRIWAQSPNASPQTWQELEAAGFTASELLVKAITGNQSLSDADLKDVSTGHALIPIKSWGINLVMFNLTKIEPFGPIYDASVSIDREKKERESEQIEVNADIKKAKALMEGSSNNLTFKEAMEMIYRYKLASEGNKTLSVAAIAKAAFKREGVES
jgi:hypothetical protein